MSAEIDIHEFIVTLWPDIDPVIVNNLFGNWTFIKIEYYKFKLYKLQYFRELYNILILYVNILHVYNKLANYPIFVRIHPRVPMCFSHTYTRTHISTHVHMHTHTRTHMHSNTSVGKVRRTRKSERSKCLSNSRPPRKNSLTPLTIPFYKQCSLLTCFVASWNIGFSQ